MKLAERIRMVMTLDPDAPAVEFKGQWTTWGELAAFADQLDERLRAAGLPEGAAVACLLRNRPEHVAVFGALITTMRTVITVNPMQGGDRLIADLRAQRPAAVVADADAWNRPELLELIDEIHAVGVRVTHRPLHSEIVTDRTRPGVGTRGQVPEGTAVLMLTSGTTGTPKRVPLFMRSLEDSLIAAEHYESKKSALRLATGVRIVIGPLVHISGMWDVLTSLVAGRRMAVLERFTVDDWVDLVRRHRPRVASLVPTALRMVLAADVDPADLASIQVVTCGTAPLEPETAEAFEAKYGTPVLILYGATEFAGGVTGWTLKDHDRFAATKRGSVGRAHPGIELRVVDPDSGAVRTNDSIGLLEVRGAQLGTDHGWVRTTDLATIDDDGFVWIKGRIDDAIVRGGFKIVPTELQRLFDSHPAVRESAVVGLPDPRLGAVPAVAVELNDGADATVDELMDFARQNLIGYQVPAQIRIVEALPRTPSLKVSRPLVVELFE